MRKRQKWVISMVTTVALLVSNVGTAMATEQVGSNTRAAVEQVTTKEVTEEKIATDSNAEPDRPTTGSSEVAEPNKVATESNATKPVHKHDWLEDWYGDEQHHWHECWVEDCPITEDSKKKGYAEHQFDDEGICTECGYSDLASQIMLLSETAIPTYQEVYEMMMALQDEYPEGMPWTNFTPYGNDGPLGDSYAWHGGSIYGASRGVGCMAFAFILSDAAFGNLRARTTTDAVFEDVKVGDILRVRGNSHSVIVLQKSAGGVVIAEANYNKSVHWGRVMSVAEVEAADFVITRYPEGYDEDETLDEEIVDEGDAGSVHWTLTNTGTLTISGSGEIPDYSAGDAPWGINYYTIVIDDNVTRIGDCAFYDSQALAVYIPDTVTEIGMNAFYGSELISVTIPESVKMIDYGAFRNCANLVSISVAEGVETIGDNAFRACIALEYVDFPSTIKSVGAGAFMDCQYVTRIRFAPSNHVVSMGDNAFTNCWRLYDVTLPETLEKISNGMFESCNLLYYLYIPAGVSSICDTEAIPIASPFKSSAIGKIDFGGSQADWADKGGGVALMYAGLNASIVTFNVAYDNPFEADPNDPGDLIPDDEEPEKPPIDPDEGETDPTDPVDPSEGETDSSEPGENETAPSKPGEGETDPIDPSEEETSPSEPGESETDPDEGEEETKPATPSTPGGGNEDVTQPTQPSQPDDGGDETQPSQPDDSKGDDDETGPENGGNETTPGGGEENPGVPGGGETGSGSSSGSNSGDNTGSSNGSGSGAEEKPDGGSSGGGYDVNGPTDDPTDSNTSSGITTSGGGSRESGNNSSNSSVVTSTRRNADGSKTTTTTQPDGTKVAITTDAAGKMAVDVTLPATVVANAQQKNEAVALPMATVSVSQDVADAPVITVRTGSEEPVKVAIPVSPVGMGTVAMLMNDDGTMEVIASSALTETAVVLSLSDGAQVKIVDNTKAFTDVPAEAWFANAATFVSARNLFDEMNEGVFALEGSMTYAMLTTALSRLDGVKPEDNAAWLEQAAAWSGALAGGAMVDPNGSFSGEELVGMIWAYAGSPVVVDATNVGPNVDQAMAWAVRKGIVDAAWDPRGQVSRAEAAYMIMNLLNNSVK